MQQKGIIRIIQIGLLIPYPILAVGIWFIPMFKDLALFNKIGFSTLCIVYCAFRVYRFTRKPTSDKES